ncbi:Receptor activity-modifying protein 3 [Sciurus carolinensis]|uniref:Receptor activity-modifying protein 3 n=1 Tax=Sciurus carolinensis TaxID=30640 RepID=A0AA41N8B3_SCICA|nr:Receptor activity-modifying protein 3 [Sciurus carolinensis]
MGTPGTLCGFVMALEFPLRVLGLNPGPFGVASVSSLGVGLEILAMISTLNGAILQDEAVTYNVAGWGPWEANSEKDIRVQEDHGGGGALGQASMAGKTLEAQTRKIRTVQLAMEKLALRLHLFPLLLLLYGGCARVCGCNETRMLERLPRCGKAFADMMHKVDVWKWCNLSEFIVYYESFTNCTEVETNVVGCYWPNPLAQGFITGIHRQFFSNCTVDRTHWEDPPDEVLIPLIVVPVILTVAMAGLVVWRSKRTDQLL